MDETEREMLAKLRGGDRRAFDYVYRTFAARVETWIRRAGRPGRSRPTTGTEDVDDLVQEVFMRAFRSLSRGQYDGLRPLGPYLHGIITNMLVDRARRGRREIPTDFGPNREGETMEDREIGGCHSDPSFLRSVDVFLASASTDLRAVYAERFVAGRSQRDAAVALGVTRQRLRTLEQRLKQGLRRMLRAKV
jgi:RNA polymerase sigma-70 factor (ECF subfamily)